MAKKSDSSTKTAGKRKAGGGLSQTLTPSSELAAIVGKEPITRSEVTKRMWDYIKKNNLQDPSNRRMINADAKLRPIFGKDQVSMFEMTKLVNQHMK